MLFYVKYVQLSWSLVMASGSLLEYEVHVGLKNKHVNRAIDYMTIVIV